MKKLALFDKRFIESFTGKGIFSDPIIAIIELVANSWAYYILSIIAIIVLSSATYKYSNRIMLKSNTPYKYKFLFRKGIYSSHKKGNKLEGKTYELAAVMKGRAYMPVYLYLKERNQYLVYSKIEQYAAHVFTSWHSRKKATAKRYVLLDKSGQEIQHLDYNLNFSVRSGLFFAPTYYVNWLEKGDSTHLKYELIHNRNLAMTKIQFADTFRKLYAKADYFEYVNLRTAYNDAFGSAVVFKIGKNWQILLSGVSDSNLYGKLNENEKTGVDTYSYRVIFDYNDPDYKLTNPYPQSPQLLHSVYLETNTPNPYRFNSLVDKGELKLKKYDKLTSTGWQGLAVIKGIPIFVPGTGNGTAYIQLSLGKENFYFKVPDVEKNDYRPIYNLGVRVFKLPGKQKNDSSLVFVESTQNGGEYRHGGGLYVVRPSLNVQANSSDLPQGITEARYAQLPLTLQEALLDIENTTELLIKSGNHYEWFNEIELLENLTHLKIRTQLKVLPDNIAVLNKLKVLLLEANNLRSISPKIKELKQLKILNLYSNNLDVFPEGICELNQLTDLDIGGNKIDKIPSCISNMKELRSLTLLLLGNITLPETILKMKELRIKRAEELQKNLPKSYHFLFKE